MNELEIIKSNQSIMHASDFETGQRVAKMLASSKLVPQHFQGNIADCVIALEMAQRMGASPLAVMQNLYIVHGKPSWSAQFIIAAINQSGKFSPLRFELNKERTACKAWAIELATNERLEGPPVTIEMAKAEGWHGKNGSKWQTMPELMLRYRAATFFGRLYAPDLLMGMRTDDEVIDIEPAKATVVLEETRSPKEVLLSSLRARLKAGESTDSLTAEISKKLGREISIPSITDDDATVILEGGANV